MGTALQLADHYPHFGEAGPWWPLFPLLWFALIAGAIFFFGFRRRRALHDHPFFSGESVLAERFARGEITEQEYRERLSVLEARRR